MKILTSFLYIIMLVCLLGCKRVNTYGEVAQLAKEWNGKEIVFPDSLEFTLFGKDFVCDTIPLSEYKIVTYIDSLGCASCKLRLPSWMELIQQLDAMDRKVPVLFYLHPLDSRSLKAVLRRDNFNYPVCMDTDDQLNRINHFPSTIDFQTFLLDKDNKVVAIGNPVHNPKIKELYLNILNPGKEKNKDRNTQVTVASTTINLGTFEQQQRDTTIYLKNVGDERLVVLDMVASCGCTVVEYDKRPVSPGDSLALRVVYSADKKGYFNKTINLHCNIASSPIVFRLTGVVQ